MGRDVREEGEMWRMLIGTLLVMARKHERARWQVI